jgi:hypothetical protein
MKEKLIQKIIPPEPLETSKDKIAEEKKDSVTLKDLRLDFDGETALKKFLANIEKNGIDENEINEFIKILKESIDFFRSSKFLDDLNKKPKYDKQLDVYEKGCDKLIKKYSNNADAEAAVGLAAEMSLSFLTSDPEIFCSPKKEVDENKILLIEKYLQQKTEHAKSKDEKSEERIEKIKEGVMVRLTPKKIAELEKSKLMYGFPAVEGVVKSINRDDGIAAVDFGGAVRRVDLKDIEKV